MTVADALDIVVARTGVERYRYLCLEHPRASTRAEYSAHVLRLASSPAPPPRPTAAESIADLAAVRRCEFRSAGRDGCQCGRCALRHGQKVTTAECLACAKLYPLGQAK
jgi:hypothetical protein